MADDNDGALPRLLTSWLGRRVLNAMLIGAITLISGMLSFGYPPRIEVLYMTGLSAFLTFLVTLRGDGKTPPPTEKTEESVKDNPGPSDSPKTPPVQVLGMLI